MRLLGASKLNLWIVVATVWVGLSLITANIPLAIAQSGTGTIRVDPAGSDTTTCGAVASPCKTIQQAIGLAQSGETIQLAAGTHTGTSKAVADLDGLNKTLTIAGTAGAIIDGQNARRGVYINGFTGLAKVTFRDITIQNGFVTGGGNDVSGGGLYCVNGAILTFSNVTFKNNKAQGSSGNLNTITGGGAGIFNCPTTFLDVVFDGNQSIGADSSPRGGQARGGGFFITSSTVTGSNLTVTNNKAISGSSGGNGKTSDGEVAQSFGGGFDIGSNSTVTFNNINVQNNVSQAGNGATFGGFGSGGGVFIEAFPGQPTTVTLTGGQISNNQAIGGNGDGTRNGFAGATGGGLMSGGTGTTGPDITMNNIVMTGNESKAATQGTAAGSALYFQAGGGFTGNNLILAKNITTPGAASTGGVIEIGANVARTLNFNHVTIANNAINGPLAGEVISIFGNGAVTVNINDSIIANQTQDEAVAFLAGSGHVVNVNRTLWFNTFSPKSTGTGTFNDNSPIAVGDPSFVDVANNNFHILGNSAAIDKTTANTLSTDVDSQSRPFGSASDVGADEFHPPLAASSKISNPRVIKAQNGPTHAISYTITLTNTGFENTTGSVEDTLPTDLTYTTGSVSCAGGGTCTYDPGTRKVTWNGTIAQNNQVTIQYSTLFTLPIATTASSIIENTAVGQFTDSGGARTYNITNKLFVNGTEIFLPIIIK